MRPPNLLTLAVCAFAGVAVLLPGNSAGQADTDDLKLQRALADVAAQQKLISENQAKIDETIAAVAEQVRQARIFAGRAGGGQNKK
jgi:hypothetical protein